MFVKDTDMYERENLPPSSSSSMITTQDMAYHGAALKQEDCAARTTSPTVLQGNPEYAASPATTSQSSTSSQMSSDHHHYNHHPHYHMAPAAASANHTSSAGSIPVPIRSPSWAAGSSEPVLSADASSVPAVITTQPAAAYSSSSKGLTVKTSKAMYVPAKKKQTAKNAKSGGGGKNSNGGVDTVTARRQKRLERNRESARLSRRRRKQYLEVLEDRVSQLSVETDQGRGAHAAKAIETVLQKRRDMLRAADTDTQPREDLVSKLEVELSRTSNELSVVSSFHTQQLKSFSLPAQNKFVLWLTLQGDTYYRGGRAASERLSAARIGERMLHSGNDRVTPVNSMWPLFCNEINLSYDQEERVRNFQRTLLQEHSSWLERHTARASGLAMQSFHDSLNAVGSSLHQRECSTFKGLRPAQRLKFMAWAEKNADRIKAKFAQKRKKLAKPKENEKFKLSQSQHTAANLYILNHRLQEVLKSLPQRVNIVTPAALKRLARRPSFESLGQQKEEADRALSRDASFASSGSLKRSASSLSIDGEEKQPEQVSPEDGEEAAAATLEKELGFITEIIPPLPPPVPPPAPRMALPPPQAYHHYDYAVQAPPQPMMTTSQPQALEYYQHPEPIAAHPGAQPVAVQYAPLPHHGIPGPTHPYQQNQQYYTHHQQAPPQQPIYAPPPQQQQQAPPQQPVYAPPPQQQQQQQAPSQQPVYAPPPPQQPVYAPPPPQQQQVQHYHHLQVPPAPAPGQPLAAPPAQAPPPAHMRQSSFLPPHLNVVPEEMFPPLDPAEDFFMSLMDNEDWVIGEGVDMDTTAAT